MESTVIVAAVSFLGTLIGTVGGIVTSAKLTNYRLEQLEKKVDGFSKTAEKMPVIEEKISGIGRRISKLESSAITGYFDGC
ncbi:MAG: hypothetical protein J6D52_00645 [Clostridia bacterium]|nr:hypothetical protein [Clostridia bacterium]